MCDSREKGHDYAEGPTVGQEAPGGSLEWPWGGGFVCDWGGGGGVLW